MTKRLLPLLLVFALATTGCESSGGGGGGGAGTNNNGGGGGSTSTGEPADSTKNEADVQVSGSESKDIEAESTETTDSTTFGGGIAAEILNLFITSSDETAISVVIDTAKVELPGSVTVGDFFDSPPAYITMTSISGTTTKIYKSFAESGTLTIDQCPTEAGVAVTGKFNGTKLRQEGGSDEVTLNGTFNLVVAAAANPTLHCKAPAVEPEPEPSPEPATGGGCPEKRTCDGPCCPYAECIGTCQAKCAGFDLTNPFAPPGEGPCAQAGQEQECIACMEGCYDECEVSAACKTAGTALGQCAENAGCDPAAEDSDTCVEEHCCDELHATF